MKKKREPFCLPPEECDRMVRSEIQAFRMLLTTLSETAHFSEDMSRQLDLIPHGKARMRLALGQLRSIVADITGTITLEQAKSLQNTTRDCEIQLRVKSVGLSDTNIVMTREHGKALIDAARDKCVDCVEDGKSCRKCSLYKVLLATSPLDDYGNGNLCPYNLAEWE